MSDRIPDSVPLPDMPRTKIYMVEVEGGNGRHWLLGSSNGEFLMSRRGAERKAEGWPAGYRARVLTGYIEWTTDQVDRPEMSQESSLD